MPDAVHRQNVQAREARPVPGTRRGGGEVLRVRHRGPDLLGRDASGGPGQRERTGLLRSVQAGGGGGRRGGSRHDRRAG